MNNGENYVVAVPTTELIINKCSSNDRCFGLYGNFTPKLKKELSDYIQQHECRKIICTYDKLPKLLALVDGKDYRLDGVLDNFKAFKSFCFMSATPIETDLKPNVLDGVTEYVADWKEPLPICVLPYQTNKPYQFAANVIGKIQDARLFGSERE